MLANTVIAEIDDHRLNGQRKHVLILLITSILIAYTLFPGFIVMFLDRLFGSNSDKYSTLQKIVIFAPFIPAIYLGRQISILGDFHSWQFSVMNHKL